MCKPKNRPLWLTAFDNERNMDQDGGVDLRDEDKVPEEVKKKEKKRKEINEWLCEEYYDLMQKTNISWSRKS